MHAIFAFQMASNSDVIYGLRLLIYMAFRSAYDAADITQECFLRAYLALARFRPGADVGPWILTIAANLCRDWARRARARPADPAGDLWALPVPDPEDPQLAAERETERQRVRQAVRELPADQRLLVVLAYDQELPLGAIAQALGLPLTVVKNRLYRIRRRIATMLEGGGGPAERRVVPSDPRPAAPPGVR